MYCMQVIRQRRHELSLNATAAGLIICDKCSSHQSETFYNQRQQFGRETNCAIMGGDRFAGMAAAAEGDARVMPMPPIPGGFGAAGGPNDGFHQFYHLARKAHTKVSIGWGNSLLLRRSLDSIDLSVVGEPSYSCDMEPSLTSDKFALEVIRRHGGGKLVLHAWLSRGYVTIEQVAKWFHAGDVEAAHAQMQAAGGSLIQTIETLQKLKVGEPDTPPTPAHIDLKAAVAGELRHVWVVSISAGDGAFHEVRLPQWVTTGIDVVVAKWVAEHDSWTREIAERTSQGKVMPPKRQSLYDTCMAATERKCPCMLHTHFAIAFPKRRASLGTILLMRLMYTEFTYG